jgi:ATP-dependent Clp protease ATP-binding subunit ClpC
VRGLFNLAAAGSAWAVVEAMREMEPHLAHGGIQCIATGSPAGLRETIEKAGMLARHFEVVPVAPVTEQDAVRIVSGLKRGFEQFHEVTFAEGAIETAIAASGRFLPDRHLPDRAIDLIDEACAAVKLRRERQEAASSMVTAEDVEAAVAARAGVPVADVRRVLEEKVPGELERIAGLLEAQVPAGAREWVPFLAAYLARCSPAEAAALAQAIAAARGTGEG